MTRHRPKILHLVTEPVLGGAQEIVCSLACQQRRRGIDVTVVTSPGGPLLERVKELGLEGESATMATGLSLRGVAKIQQIVKERKIDLLHAHGARASLHAFLALRLGRKVPLVGHVHLFDRWRFDNSWRARVDGFIARRLDRIIACSERLRAALLERQGYPSSTVSVPNGIRLEPFLARLGKEQARKMLGLPEDAVIAGVCARLEPQKGHRFLIDALGLLSERLPKLILAVAGTGSLRKKLELKTESLGLGSRVHWLGFQKEVPTLLAALDLFVLPSLYEGLPLAVIEAMAAGLPVVATEVSGTPEIVRPNQTGWLVKAGSPEALARAMEEALTDPMQAQRLASAGHRLVTKTHSVAAMENRVFQIYSELTPEIFSTGALETFPTAASGVASTSE